MSSIGRRRIAARVLAYREIFQYHGVWAPGVRLLQNLKFRNKALLLLVCLLVPLAYLVQGEWRRIQGALDTSGRAIQGMSLYADAMRTLDANAKVRVAMFHASSDSEVGIKAQNEALADEEASFGRLIEGVRASPALPPLASAQLALAAQHRDAALKLRNDKSAGKPDAAPPRMRALHEYSHQLEVLRLRLLRVSSVGSQDDELMNALLRGGLEPLPPIDELIRQAKGVGARIYGEDARAAQGRRLTDSLAEYRLRLETAEQELDPAMSAGLVDVATTRQALVRLRAFHDRARQVATASMTAANEHDMVVTVGIDLAAYDAEALAALVATRALHQVVLDAAVNRLQGIDAATRKSALLAATLLVLGLGSVAYLLVCMNKVVGGGLRELGQRVDALAQGDLSDKPEARGRDEVGQAMVALRASVRRMSTLFEAVTQGVAAVSHASREVATGNAGLTGRTGDIRRSIGEVGERARSFMEAMNLCGAEVERISEHMRDVRADAQRSRKSMAALQERMQGLQQKSRDIARVVSLVEAIAYQTRLLSLNASVEASRAGAAGKGFAVVAQEVRDLALRSEAATRKIHGIVNASVAEIEQGGMLTERVGEAVRHTDERIAEVSGIVIEIVRLTRTGRSQSQEVVEIARDVEDSAGGNARMVDQLAHASAGLREQGDNLKRSMQHFVFE